MYGVGEVWISYAAVLDNRNAICPEGGFWHGPFSGPRRWAVQRIADSLSDVGHCTNYAEWEEDLRKSVHCDDKIVSHLAAVAVFHKHRDVPNVYKAISAYFLGYDRVQLYKLAQELSIPHNKIDETCEDFDMARRREIEKYQSDLESEGDELFFRHHCNCIVCQFGIEELGNRFPT